MALFVAIAELDGPGINFDEFIGPLREDTSANSVVEKWQRDRARTKLRPPSIAWRVVEAESMIDAMISVKSGGAKT